MPSEGPGVYLMVIITPILFFNTQDVICATNSAKNIIFSKKFSFGSSSLLWDLL